MLNSISLIGRLVRDPDLRATPSGTSVCRFTIANEKINPASRDKEVFFIDIIAWSKTAEFVNKWFKKGAPISLTGSLQTHTLIESDGKAKKVYEVHAATVDFVPRDDRDITDADAAEAPGDDAFPF